MSVFSRRSKAMRRKGLKLWKHGMTKYLKTRASIEKINANLLLRLWCNVDFMQWVWMFAVKISHDRRTLVARLMEEGSNIMEIVSKSDIAWSCLVSWNNDKYWPMLSVVPALEAKPSEDPSEDRDEEEDEEDPTLPRLIPHRSSKKARTQPPEDGVPPESPSTRTRSAKKSASEAPSPKKTSAPSPRKTRAQSPRKSPRKTRAQGPAKGGRRGGGKGSPTKSGKTPKSSNKRKATDIPEDEENTSPKKAQGSKKNQGIDEEAGEDYELISPKRGMAEKLSRWTKASNTRTNSDGWSEEGKLVYEKIRRSLMEIPADAWSEVWKEFWFVERERWLSENRRRKIRRMEREVALEPVVEDVGLLFSDDEEVEGGPGDEAMDETL